MPGMGSEFQVRNPAIVTLFRHALREQAIWVLAIAAVLAIAFAVYRVVRPTSWKEPRGRTVLRLGFGALWILDGLLQLQQSMPLGMASQVLSASNATTPTWMRGLVHTGITIWNEHPIAFAAIVVWGQIGLGAMLLMSAGRVSRIGGACATAWALTIWVATGFGGLFTSTGSILFGWPGAVPLYAIAGFALARRATVFPRTFTLGATKLLSAMLALGAFWQCLPSNGFWRTGSDNALAQMAADMADMQQPVGTKAMLHAFGAVCRVLGPSVNFLVMAWLLATAWGLWQYRVTPRRWVPRSLVIGSLLFWALVQDFGVFGGMATDANSLLPLALLGVALAYRFQTPAPLRQPPSWFVLRPLHNVALGAACAMLAVAIVSSAWALVTAAEPTLYNAANSGIVPVSTPAPHFTLRDQHERALSIGGSTHQPVLLTFLDPVCYQECVVIGQQLRDVILSYGSQGVDVVAVVANDRASSQRDVRHFLRRNHFDVVPNFHMVTGTLAQLRSVWNDYGITVSPGGEGGMSIHTNVVYVLDTAGSIRFILQDTPAAGTAGRASTVTVLRDALATLGFR